MRKIFLRLLVAASLGFALLAAGVSAASLAGPEGLEHRGQKIFLSGMNLAWINFGHDLENFDEATFRRALDEIASAGGNALRWWLHTNGSQTPTYGPDGKVIGISRTAIATMRRALDLAYEKGIGIIMCLWSFDMLQRQTGVNTTANKKLVEDKEYTKAYIENALVPIIRALKDHPAVYAWEVCNEPEGMTDTFGWTPIRTQMRYVQQFVNLIAGAIHREAPGAKVTNGSWSFLVLTDVDGMTNYYRDDRLIAAGGDPQGTLDFYQVHYYPQHFDERISPFHHPASYWQLDKPILIGEFPAKGIVDLGRGFRPKTPLAPTQAYRWAIETGYIGALAWTWTGHDGHGGVADAAPGMRLVRELYPELVTLKSEKIDRLPSVKSPIPSVSVGLNAAPIPAYVDLRKVFYDEEDGTDLRFSVVGNTNPELVTVELREESLLGLGFAPNASGRALITVRAVDKAGQAVETSFRVFVVDEEKDNLALLKPVQASSIESTGHLAAFVNDGDPKTRWSTKYADDQWLVIDLGKEYEIARVVIDWEVAYGRHYRLLVSRDGENWEPIYEQKEGKGGREEITFAPVKARYVKLHGLVRGTGWGFSIWEFEVFHR